MWPHSPNLLTSIFSSSFFWSISVIRRWSIETDGTTLSEPDSSFLMQDWQKREEEGDQVTTNKLLQQ